MFSQHINESHLTECISLLLHLYSETNKVDINAAILTDWFRIEALHILLSENAGGLYRALNHLPSIVNSRRVVKDAIEISISLWLGNFVRAHRISLKLPIILQVAYCNHFPKYRRRVLETYDKSHRTNQGSKFPLDKLSRYLLSSVEDASSFCETLGFVVEHNTLSVIFKTGRVIKPDDKAQNVKSVLIEELENVNVRDFLYGKIV